MLRARSRVYAGRRVRDLVATPMREGEDGPGRQAEQVHAAGGDVLAHLPGGDVEARIPQLFVKLRVDEVHLPEVRLRRALPEPGAVLYGLADVGVALDAEPGQEPDALLGRLAEGVLRAAGDRGHVCVHHPALLSRASGRPEAYRPSGAGALPDGEGHDPEHHAKGGEEAAP